MKKLMFGIVCGAILLLAGCPNPVTMVPTETITYVPDGLGNIQFKTNNTAYYGYYWYQKYTSTQAATSTVTATVTKMSGAQSYGYGVLFGYQDSSNYYAVLITEDGWYTIGVVQGGTYSAIQSWAQSSNIYTGYGVANTIKVSYNDAGASNQYAVYINNMTTPIKIFSPSAYIGTSGCAAFYSTIGKSGSEQFPNVPVDIRFKMTAPVAIP